MLFGYRAPRYASRGLSDLTRRAVGPLRALHSGHIGDYVAGVALLGGSFAIALQ